ncbi:MAG: TolC family protein [Prevotellaceae bacterium]|nr:TolC family protein [Prevotellaceae bacterium]
MRKKLLLLSVLAVLFPAVRAQSLEECRQAAEHNYPIIRQYDLIARTTELTVRNIQKAWFPQISVTAQGSYQNKVTAWPENLQGMFAQMGIQLQGLSRDQYKVGIDVRQTLFDGGTIGSRREIARGEGAVQAAQTEVDLYKIGQRVHEMYFGLLLLDEQLRLNADVNALLRSNEAQLAAMLKSGTASAGDFENVKAERLSAEQQQTELLSQRQTLQRLLSLFCGIPVDSIRRPAVPNLPSGENKRPELRLFDRRLQLTAAQEKAVDAQLLPQLGLFAQGYYGNPGLNLFEDMMKRRWSWNGIAGLKLTWNLSALYTHRNEKSKLRVQRELIENARQQFLFNNQLDETQQSENVRRFRAIAQRDGEIIALRTAVRKAAESKLAHGIIDVNGLLREINKENAAKTQQAIHEIDMLKAMYDLKFSHNE